MEVIIHWAIHSMRSSQSLQGPKTGPSLPSPLGDRWKSSQLSTLPRWKSYSVEGRIRWKGSTSPILDTWTLPSSIWNACNARHWFGKIGQEECRYIGGRLRYPILQCRRYQVNRPTYIPVSKKDRPLQYVRERLRDRRNRKNRTPFTKQGYSFKLGKSRRMDEYHRWTPTRWVLADSSRGPRTRW